MLVGISVHFSFADNHRNSTWAATVKVVIVDWETLNHTENLSLVPRVHMYNWLLDPDRVQTCMTMTYLEWAHFI